MTENENGRPGAGAAVETNSAGGGAVEAIVPRGTDRPPHGRADVSLVPPSFGRSTWRAVARCADDGSVTVHRFEDPDGVNGATRTGACGCRYILRVRRTLATWGTAA